MLQARPALTRARSRNRPDRQCASASPGHRPRRRHRQIGRRWTRARHRDRATHQPKWNAEHRHQRRAHGTHRSRRQRQHRPIQRSAPGRRRRGNRRQSRLLSQPRGLERTRRSVPSTLPLIGHQVRQLCWWLRRHQPIRRQRPIDLAAAAAEPR